MCASGESAPGGTMPFVEHRHPGILARQVGPSPLGRLSSGSPSKMKFHTSRRRPPRRRCGSDQHASSACGFLPTPRWTSFFSDSPPALLARHPQSSPVRWAAKRRTIGNPGAHNRVNQRPNFELNRVGCAPRSGQAGAHIQSVVPRMRGVGAAVPLRSLGQLTTGSVRGMGTHARG